MTKKQEKEALTSLEKLDELTQDILKNNTDGGDANFRQIVFSGLTQTKNQILLDKMNDLLFVDDEEDLKKTIILGIFIHKEIFEPVIEYGESVINMPYLDESYDNKDSFLFILDALIELAYKDKLNDFETGTSLLFQLYKLSCSEKSHSLLADKLLQRFLNSKIGTVKTLQKDFLQIIEDENEEINLRVIAVDILARANYTGVLAVAKNIFDKMIDNSKRLEKELSLLDVLSLSLSYFRDKKYSVKFKSLLSDIKKININSEKLDKAITDRIKTRIKKYQDELNSRN